MSNCNIISTVFCFWPGILSTNQANIVLIDLIIIFLGKSRRWVLQIVLFLPDQVRSADFERFGPVNFVWKNGGFGWWKRLRQIHPDPAPDQILRSRIRKNYHGRGRYPCIELEMSQVSWPSFDAKTWFFIENFANICG